MDLKKIFLKIKKRYRTGIITGKFARAEHFKNELGIILSIEESLTFVINKIQESMDKAMMEARQSFINEGNYSFTDRELAVVSSLILGRKFKKALEV